MKYREFWIKQFNNNLFFGSCVEQEVPGGDHVIEFAAYEKMKADCDTLLADYLVLQVEYDSANKMLEEMAETLEFYESCHICSRCNPALKSKALEKYRKFKEGLK